MEVMKTEAMTAEQAAEWGKTLSFESVWAALQETDRIVKENARELAKTERLVKELSKNVGGVNGSLGDMAEGLMASDLYETFEALGLDFDHSFQNYKVKDRKTKRKLTEVDMLLVNGTIAMAVEVKTTMTQGDVDGHEIRMDVLRHEPNSLFANRKLYGAMAGVKMSPQARKYAIDKGFFVIELTGNTIKVDMPDGFTPKTW
jgi:phenylalanyl-tRNA synthetase beta subunit